MSGARGEFLRRLVGGDFLPPVAAVGEVNAAAGAKLPDPPDDAVRDRDRAAVEAFAREYWSLSPADRAARMESFAEGCTDPASGARLLHLADGVAVAPVALADPDAEELAALFRALFVLPPRDRAVARNRWLLDHAKDHERWSKAAAVLQAQDAALVELEPMLAWRLGDLRSFHYWAAEPEARRLLDIPVTLRAVGLFGLAAACAVAVSVIFATTPWDDPHSGTRGGLALFVAVVVASFAVGSLLTGRTRGTTKPEDQTTTRR